MIRRPSGHAGVIHSNGEIFLSQTGLDPSANRLFILDLQAFDKGVADHQNRVFSPYSIGPPHVTDTKPLIVRNEPDGSFARVDLRICILPMAVSEQSIRSPYVASKEDQLLRRHDGHGDLQRKQCHNR